MDFANLLHSTTACMNTLYPPRPKGKMLHTQLPQYEKTGLWVAQRKFNGQRNLVDIDADGKVKFCSRHGGDPHGNFVPSKALLDEFKALHLENGKEYRFDSELLATKTTTPQYKGIVILFDVLHIGKYLFGGPDLMARQKILVDICGNPTVREPGGIAFMITPHIWLAETFSDNFTLHYEEMLEKPEIEGLVLKKKNSVLDHLGHVYYEIGWLIRCRKPTKNYGF